MEELLKTAESETTRLDVILKQFLQAIRPTRPIREPYNIETILMEVLKLLEPEIQQRGIQINTDLQPSLPILSLTPSKSNRSLQPDQNAYQSILRREAPFCSKAVIRMTAYSSLWRIPAAVFHRRSWAAFMNLS